jgi:excisionase family DNA binding protein
MFNDRLYTVQEVAELLKVSVRSVYRMIEDQDIESTKVRCSTRIYGSSLNDYLERNKPEV